MRLKKLEIYGFKSFAQKTEIIFNQGITGIVGPNGSGKSNIGDAVRWVLGEQSAKTLRGSKMEDIIFNGTQKRKAMAYCEVSLVFDNEDHYLPIDYNEVMVTRRVYRNGESEYYINKNASRLRDIVELFRDTGIGKEGYSIIGQGRIDSILSQKGEERRQIFEEAAGIVKFKSRKEEAERKLNKTLDNLSRVEDIIEELHRQLEPLEKQAKDAKQYLDLSSELKQLDVNIFLLRHDKAKSKVAELEQALEGLEAVVAQGEGFSQEKNQLLVQLEGEIEKLEEEIGQNRAILTEKTNQRFERLNQQQLVQQKISQTQEKEEEHRHTIDQLKEKKEQLLLLQKDSSQSSTLQEEKREEALGQLQLLEKDLEQMYEQLSHAENELEEKKSHMMEAINRASMAKNSQTRQLAVLSQMEKRVEEVIIDHQKAEEKVESSQKQVETAQEVYEKTLAVQIQRKNDMEKAEEKVRVLGEEIQQKSQAIQVAQQQLHGLESRLKLLKEMSQEFEGYYQSVKKALTYAKKQNNKRVHGVVAMLMKVPKDLETAVDMVLSSALQNIVTEDEHTAKELIQYLRENRLGRATFLPVTTIRGRTLNNEERKVLTLPGCVGVASELIAFDEKYRPIMENLLGRTIIAEDLDAGIAIMRKGNHGFRLVTLKGDVMHSGGSMSGGSIQSKATNLLGREREIEELGKTLEKGQHSLAEEKLALNDLEVQRNEEKEERSKFTYALHQEEIAVAREQERLENSKEDLENAKDYFDQTAQAKNQLEEGIALIKADLASLEKQADFSETNQQTMEEQVEQLQKSLIFNRGEFEKAKDEVNQKRLDQAAISHEWELLKKDRDRVEAELKQIEQDLVYLNQAIENSKASLLRLQGEEQGFEGRSQEEEAAIAKLENSGLHLEEKRKKTQQKTKDLRQEIEELHNQMNDMTGKAHRSEIQRTKIQSELENMQERIWNTYELTYGTASPMRQEDFELTKGEKRGDVIRSQIRQIGPVNVNAIEDYVSVSHRYEDLTTQQNDLLLAREDLQTLIDKLLIQMEEQFVEQFSLLQEYFQETFVRLFGGGKAELRLEDSKDPLNCGIEVIAQPPGKKLQLLSLLSGGERALTAIAILFAMLKLKPTPFCILDEIEAALDDANINYFADYLSEYSKNTQFVVVTHRKGTMERCDALYGVAMEEKGVSKMVSVNLKDYAS